MAMDNMNQIGPDIQRMDERVWVEIRKRHLGIYRQVVDILPNNFPTALDSYAENNPIVRELRTT